MGQVFRMGTARVAVVLRPGDPGWILAVLLAVAIDKEGGVAARGAVRALCGFAGIREEPTRVEMALVPDLRPPPAVKDDDGWTRAR